MTREESRVWERHRKVHGGGLQHTKRLMDQAIEECGELVVALSHHQRNRATTQQIAEEFADLSICMEFLFRSFGVHPDFFRVARKKNLRRVTERLPEIELNRGHV